MRKRLAAVAIAAGLGGSALTWQFGHDASAPKYVLAQDLKTPSLTFAPMLRKATPAVVRIEAESRPVRTSQNRRNRGGNSEIPPGFEDFFGQFFGNGRGMTPPQERRGGGLGSGVIVTNDGYILTNNHVVDQATNVNVVLSDRREFKAKIVGADPLSDIAVLKVDGGSLPVLPISDSGRVQVGDVALAIGNPFGIGQTVTMGIVSATGRGGLGIEQYEDFIQTDASINPGNSGGALVNTDGQLIGINTAILAGGGGGNQGIGFAIPVNMVRNIMDQIVKTGKVTRGYMGAGIQDVSPQLQRAFKLSGPTGAVITRVEPGKPAEKAGLQAGDVVLQVNDTAISDSNSLRNRISSTAPGTTVRLKVQRQSGTQDINVTLAPLAEQNGESDDEPELRGGNRSPLEGLSVDDLTADVAQQLQLPGGTRGVVVTAVEQGSAAAEAGLRRGDVITQVNRKSVTSAREFETAVRGTGQVLLLVNRGGGSLFIVVESGRK